MHWIIDDNGYRTLYAHMIREPSVNVGDTIEQGDVIGNVGSTGRSFGNHLHFEARRNGELQNPIDYFTDLPLRNCTAQDSCWCRCSRLL